MQILQRRIHPSCLNNVFINITKKLHDELTSMFSGDKKNNYVSIISTNNKNSSVSIVANRYAAIVHFIIDPRSHELISFC